MSTKSISTNMIIIILSWQDQTRMTQVCLEVLMAVSMKMAVFWVVAPMRPLIALMMEVVQTSQTLVNSYQSTQCYNPEDSHLQLTSD
jgi:hypothetical protein